MKQINSIQPALANKEVLAETISTFDPIVCLTPPAIVMNILLVELWQKGKEWDEKMSNEEIKRWKEIIGGLEDITG